MSGNDFGQLFQGVYTLITSETYIAVARIGLIILGLLLIYLGKKGVLS